MARLFHFPIASTLCGLEFIKGFEGAKGVDISCPRVHRDRDTQGIRHFFPGCSGLGGCGGV
ncbi:hypothetical protein D3C72_1855090 [compost metagenome]